MSANSTVAPATASRQELITNAIDKTTAGNLTINRESGGMAFQNMGEVMEFAKLMAVSAHAVPPHCRNNPGLCLGLAVQAIEWRMSPYAVASKSYVVNDRIGYESQLIHAVIEQRAPITCRLRHKFIGEGSKRQCVVWATAKGETEPLEYVSTEFGTITPKNSPLWKSKPDLQLYYNASRDWARMYFPDVILGVYAEDELEPMPGSQAIATERVVTPKDLNELTQRLTAAKRTDDERQTTTDDEGPDFQSAIDAQNASAVDQAAPPDDGNQTADMGDPSSPTPEELRELEQTASGKAKQKSAFETNPNLGK